MEYIYLSGAIEALFFAALFTGKKELGIEKKLLSLWFLTLGIHLSILFLLNKSYFENIYILVIFHLTFPLLHYPIFYLYVKSLINKTTRLKLEEGLHFAPFLILFLTHCLFPENRNNLSISNDPGRLIHTNLIINLILGSIYMSQCVILLHRYNKRIKHTFSNLDKVNLKWLAHLIFSFLIVLLVGITYIILIKAFQLKLNINIDLLIYGSVTFFVFFVGFYSIRKTNLFFSQYHGEKPNGTSTIQKGGNKYGKYGLKQNEIPALKETLLNFMDDEKPYLNCDLTLTQLAEKLNIYKHYLTQVLNEELNQNFYDFINTYRIEEVKKRLADNNYDHYTILGIGFEAGFNSKSSFNRIFKNNTGLTPSQYKSSLSQK